jgi:signal transduction histidine kinase
VGADDLTPDDLTVVDLLEEIRAALDGLGPLLLGRTVDVEMPRLRVLADGVALRQELGDLVETAVTNTDRSDAITVRVARAGKSARIEVVSDRGEGTGTSSSITVPLAPGASGHADT